jgi:hypothetical protein
MTTQNETPYEGLEELVEGFLNERLREYPIIVKCLLSKDYASIKSYMHKWKGFCEPYGFGPLGDLSRQLESEAEKKSFSDCELLLQKIHTYLDKRKAQL